MHVGKLLAWLPVALAAMTIGCQLELENAPCPCAPGWVCCAATNICVADSVDHCPDPDGEPPIGHDAGELPDGPDAGAPPGPDAGDLLGPQRDNVQRLQLEHGWLGDGFGSAVALAGDLVAVGVPGRDDSASQGGSVVVFERRGGGTGVWVRTAVITAPDPAPDARFGSAVAFVGPALLVGAPGAAAGAGHAYLFQPTADGWAWQQTLAMNVADAPPMLGFGAKIAVDGDHAVVGTAATVADVFTIAPAGATHVARLAQPGPLVATQSEVAIHHTSVLVSVPTGARGTYLFEAALGWAPMRVADASVVAPAFDGQRLAIQPNLGGVRVIERTSSGWSDPVELPLVQPGWRDPRALDMVWRGDELLVVVKEVDSSAAGVTRLRAIGGVWQVEPIFDLAQDRAFTIPLAVDGERAVLGIPIAAVDGTITGQVKVYHLDTAGLAEESTISFDHGPSANGTTVIAGAGHVLVNTLAGEQTAWFERDPEGRYRRRPSLVLERAALFEGPMAVGGGHALVGVRRARTTGEPPRIQAYELGEHDWRAGQSLADSEDVILASAHSIAIAGDTAVIDAQHTGLWSGIFVFEWSTAGWTHASTLDSGLSCAPTVALTETRIALYCGQSLRLYQRAGRTWHEMPVPKVPLGTGIEVLLSGDRIAVISVDPTDDRVASAVFRWTDGRWLAELHLRDERSTTDCRFACRFGIGALSGDRLVVRRDASSLTPYRFIDGAWAEQPHVELPNSQRSPLAFVRQPWLTEDELLVAVDADGDGLDPQANAIYVYPWR